MKATRRITPDRATLTAAEFHRAHANRRLIAAAARRNEVRWAVARTLPVTPDRLWHELNEAEYQYRKALQERGVYASLPPVEQRN